MSATYNGQIEIVIFQNNKAKSDKAPQETGTVTFPDGTKYEVALWNKVSKNGNPFKSGVLKLDNGERAQRTQGSQGGGYQAPRGGSDHVDF